MAVKDYIYTQRQIIIMAGMAVFYVAGYIIEERRSATI